MNSLFVSVGLRGGRHKDRKHDEKGRKDNSGSFNIIVVDFCTIAIQRRRRMKDSHQAIHPYLLSEWCYKWNNCENTWKDIIRYRSRKTKKHAFLKKVHMLLVLCGLMQQLRNETCRRKHNTKLAWHALCFQKEGKLSLWLVRRSYQEYALISLLLFYNHSVHAISKQHL